jgi:phospholipid/cholesterol/gamma-HCH transport system substrate-binding protein
MTRTKRLLAGVAAAVASTLALSGCGFHGLYSANLPGGADLGSHPYTVTIYFGDVLDLVPQSAVKVNDVAVGKVESIRLSDAKDGAAAGATGAVSNADGGAQLNGWTARVTVEVNGNVHLPANARAAVQMTSLLGEKYVDLEQPLDQPSTQDLHSGSVIPISRTNTAPEVEQVLGALSLLLNGGGLQQIHTITTELNKALKGNEGAVRDLLTQLNTFTGTLDRQKGDIVNALDALDTLTTTLNKQKATIVHALDTFPQALEVLKDERTQLVTALSGLAKLGTVASRVVTETQTDLVSSLKSLSPVLEQLTAAGQNLPNALRIAGTFPFPVGVTRQLVRGDYANLHLILDLNLSDELCGINSALCNLLPTSASATPLTTTAGSQSLSATLIGAGR